jgi:hypothetical protein
MNSFNRLRVIVGKLDMTGAVGCLRNICRSTKYTIHACTEECKVDLHYICIRHDIRQPLCERYTGGCCLESDCEKVHCAASALYFAEQAGLKVEKHIIEQIWEEISDLYSTNAKYYWFTINSMNEIFNRMFNSCESSIMGLLIPKSVRNIIAQYVGEGWHINESTVNDDSGSEFEMIKTRNKKFENCRGFDFFDKFDLCWSCYNYLHRGDLFVMIKKVDNEYLITTTCDYCYDSKSSDPLYHLGLNGFNVFLVDKSGNVNEDKCVIRFIDKNILEVVKFEPAN